MGGLSARPLLISPSTLRGWRYGFSLFGQFDALPGGASLCRHCYACQDTKGEAASWGDGTA